MTLFRKTLELIQTRSVRLTLRKISEDTGLSESWLEGFHEGRIQNPSVNRVQKLYEYLTNSTLKV